MLTFAERTGLTSQQTAQRYLWTDAFAVCNFLALSRTTGEDRFTRLALQLVDQVHRVLGRRRADDPRPGWLSGLGEEEGASHPTQGGLRIGKKLAERRPWEPFDERLEWDRDGQYFHYLTKWMHALDQVSRATRQPHFNLWARELAEVAHRAFSYGGAERGRRGMVWKMSSDLSHPLVRSMGQHDALDGLITCAQLQCTAAELGMSEGPSMIGPAADFAAMIDGRDLSTVDPLGIGGLLTDAARVDQLMSRGAFPYGDLLDRLLALALGGLAEYVRQGDFEQPASRRLAFRELGLAIGLHAIEIVRTRPAALTPYVALGDAIESFWLDPEHQRARTWADHRDINEVMLATRLVPESLLVLPP
jgi:hypothetical protein